MKLFVSPETQTEERERGVLLTPTESFVLESAFRRAIAKDKVLVELGYSHFARLAGTRLVEWKLADVELDPLPVVLSAYADELEVTLAVLRVNDLPVLTTKDIPGLSTQLAAARRMASQFEQEVAVNYLYGEILDHTEKFFTA